MHQFHDVLVSFAERREIYMNKYYNDENHYIGTFTILDEEIDGEIICNKKTGEIFLDLAKQLDEKSFMGKSYANMPVISGKINSGAFVTLFNRIIYILLTIFLYLLKCPQSLILSALRAFCFCGKPHISRSIFLYFRYQAWLKSW